MFSIDDSGNITCKGTAVVDGVFKGTAVVDGVLQIHHRIYIWEIQIIGIVGAAGNYSTWAAQKDVIVGTLTGTKFIL